MHDFSDPDWNTRFLGDLYQDLSEATRKKYALLQTPEFVEEFILDRTLEPALDEFGLVVSGQSSGGGAGHTENYQLTTDYFKMIDPACGSGHFLLDSFTRLLERWLKKEPGTNVRELVQRALNSVHGVDVNPYAVAIARFRLLLDALRESGIRQLQDAPNFHFNLAVGDSLLHGVPGREQLVLGIHELAHYYQSEDLPALRRILQPGTYHAVVANPPYITAKDSALNQAYRDRYSACHRKYSLSVPFMERIFQLAVLGGYTGQITANSFMKREFGRKLIEEFLPHIDLTHVIDTSGAYIPGHGTPTVILFGRHRPPVSNEIRAVLGIRGEPSTPDDPSQGWVWRSIVDHLDRKDSQNEFVSVADMPRTTFAKHPWSVGGGGAADLKDHLDSALYKQLRAVIEDIGVGAVTLEDEAYQLPYEAAKRHGLPKNTLVGFVVGDLVRDWVLHETDAAIFPYDKKKLNPKPMASVLQFLWPLRANLWNRTWFRKTQRERGMTWYEYGHVSTNKFRIPLSIAFAFVATHNHFVLDRGGKVFKQSAPIIKLPSDATEDDYLALLGLLNSSTACFWMKQVCTGKHKGDGGQAHADPAYQRFEFDGTKLQRFPVTLDKPAPLAEKLDDLAHQRHSLDPKTLLVETINGNIRQRLDEFKSQYDINRHQMVTLQEELDWQCYQLYGLIDEELTYGEGPPPIQLGQRAFEIVMARKMATGELETTWFERHGSTPITEVPAEWPEDYRQLVERRIELIETDRNIGLIEQPEYKRRWNTEPWESQLERALRNWLLDRLESYFDFDGRMKEVISDQSSVVSGEESASSETDNCQLKTDNLPPPLAEIQLVSVAHLADVAAQDKQFMEVAALYRDDSAFDVQKLVAELVEVESVPLLPILRYKESGLRKRAEWEQTWELQREEDRVTQRRQDAKEKGAELSASAPLREIPVPPKYTSSDFANSTYWRLRGKLDVPKERWVSFPYCEGEDGTLMIAWAGYNHLQLARAISVYYVDVQERLGGRDDPRLVPLLACLIEVLPWLKQWHNDVDPEFDMQMGDYFEGFIQEEARQMGKTLEEIKAWKPPQRTARRRRKTASA